MSHDGIVCIANHTGHPERDMIQTILEEMGIQLDVQVGRSSYERGIAWTVKRELLVQ